MQTKRSFNYWQWKVIICSMIGYSMFYFVRKNFSFAMPVLGDEYGIKDSSFGIILTLGGLVYGLSKFANGFIADRANARWHLVIALTACVVLNALFGWSPVISRWISGSAEGPDFVGTLVTITAVFIILNNLFQGAGFGPCNRLLVHWIPPKELATKMSLWNMSHSIGAGIVAVLCGAIVASSHWQWCFWIPAIISGAGVFFIFLTLRDTPKSVGLPELPDTKTELDDNDSPAEYRRFVKKMVFRNPIVWLCAISDMFLYVVRFAVLDWGPKFLQQGDNPLSPTLAGWTIGIFEVCGCIGMLLAGWLTDKLFKGKGQQMCLVEMVLCALCLIAIHFLPEGASPVIMLSLLALAGFFLYGPQALYCVVTGKHATKKAASAAAGLVGLFCYVSVLFTGLGIGFLSDTFGQYFWNNLFIIMAGVSVLSAAVLIPIWNIKDDGYLHEA